MLNGIPITKGSYQTHSGNFETTQLIIKFSRTVLWVCSVHVYSQLRNRSLTRSTFLPRCMECRCELRIRILSVCLSVCQTRALWQNGRKTCVNFYTIRKLN